MGASVICCNLYSCHSCCTCIHVDTRFLTAFVDAKWANIMKKYLGKNPATIYIFTMSLLIQSVWRGAVASMCCRYMTQCFCFCWFYSRMIYSLVFESTVFFSHSPHFCLLISILCDSKICFWVLILKTPFTPVHPHPASTTV